MNIEELLHAETSNIDFKEALNWKKPKSWLKSVSAFANSSGGKVLFGVSDDGISTGINDSQFVIDRVSELIASSLDPAPEYLLDVVECKNGPLVVLEVFPGDDCPYFYMRDGVQQAYIRAGSTSIPATAQ